MSAPADAFFFFSLSLFVIIIPLPLLHSQTIDFYFSLFSRRKNKKEIRKIGGGDSPVIKQPFVIMDISFPPFFSFIWYKSDQVPRLLPPSRSFFFLPPDRWIDIYLRPRLSESDYLIFRYMKGYIDKNKTKQSKNTEIHWQEKKDVVSSTAAMMAFYNTKKKKRVMRPISRWFKKNKRKTNDTTGQTNAIDVIEVLAFFTRLRETL